MDKQTAINGGKELASILIDYCAKDAGGNKLMQEYIDEMNSGKGIFKEQKDALKVLSDSGEQMQNGTKQLLDTFTHNNDDMSKVFSSFEHFTGNVKNIVDANKSSTERLSKLNDQIRNIQQHTDEINDISERTNLLSFNASIEAARAGEAGKGFRIIANEVKNLSDSTKKTSQEIANMVVALGDQITAFINENSAKNKLLEQLVQSTEESKQILAKMKSDSDNNSASTQKMLSLLEQNQQNIEQVVSSVAKGEQKNIAQVQQFADNASQNLVLFNDIISFSVEMNEIFKYLEKESGGAAVEK